MSIVGWLLFGLIAGVLAKVIMPGRDPGGCLTTIGIGVGGAFVGGFLYETLLGGSSYMTFSVGSMITAVVGALLLLGVYRVIF